MTNYNGFSKIKILPMHVPIISTYPTESNMLSVFSTNDQAMAWFYENYYQLFTNGRFKFSSYIDFWAPLPWFNCPFFESKKYGLSIESNITDIFINAINDYYYIFLPLNHRYIRKSGMYEKVDHAHETFIYGYNMDNNIFHIADFFNGKYGFIEATFDEIRNSYNDVHKLNNRNDSLHDMLFMRFKNYEEYSFSVDNFKKNVQDYLLSKPTIDPTKVYRQYYFEHKEKHVFGLDVFDFLISLIYKIRSQDVPIYEKTIDIRGFHMLYEHKNLVSHTLQYLEKNNYLSEEREISDLCNYLIREALKLRNTVLKFNLCKNLKLFEHLTYQLESIKKIDKDFARLLLERL